MTPDRLDIAAAAGADMAPRSASVAADHPDPVTALARGLGPGPFSLVILFVSIEAQLDPLLKSGTAAFPGAQIIGCTTAGEITEAGYQTGQILAMGFPAAGFAVELLLIEHLDRLETRDLVSQLLAARQALGRRAEAFPHELALMLVDGISGREEALIAALAAGLGQVPMIGGSAGDAGFFGDARVLANGRRLERGAVLCLMRSKGAFRHFSLDTMRPSSARMIVTGADPINRIVTRINDEPAALEYARLLDIPPETLSPFIFATQPVMVRAGGRYHVRAIRRATADHGLAFYGAIAEGMVLTIAEPEDMTTHLTRTLSEMFGARRPELILGFDCIFRRIDAEGRQKLAEVSRVLSAHRVVGFSTYGEQFGGLHVNQTLTGVAFFSPDDPA